MISGQSTRYKTPDYAVSMPLITLNKIFLTFGDPPLLDGVDLQIQPGERLCLLGRNGTGKSTLMKIMVGMVTPDRGEIIRQKHLRIVLLGQDIPEGVTGTVHEVASEYVPSVQAGPPVVDTVLSRMQLESDLLFETLSVGLKRRTLLAQALAAQPDVLLLDEPTNHLDIEAITWLESFLLKQRGSLLFVTHDRLLTHRLATRILNIDQGRLTSWDCDYPTYLQRREAQLEAEAGEQKAFDRKLDEEEVWIRQGIRARRTRDEGRVRALERMRKERANRRALPFGVSRAQRSARQVVLALAPPAFGDNRRQLYLHLYKIDFTVAAEGHALAIGQESCMRVIRTGLFRFYPPVSSKLAKYFRCGIAFARHPQFGRFVVELIDYEPILFWIRTVMGYARSSQHAFFVALQIAPPQALWLAPAKSAGIHVVATVAPRVVSDRLPIVCHQVGADRPENDLGFLL